MAYLAPIEQRRKWRKSWHDRHPEATRLDGAKQRAKEKGLEFNITEDDYSIPKFCPVLNIPIIQGQNRPTDNSPALDRIDNSLGYVKGNVRIISNRANELKNDATLDEVIAIAVYMATHKVNRATDAQP
jgi:hypothetical protein